MADSEELPEWHYHPEGEIWRGIDGSYLVVYKHALGKPKHFAYPYHYADGKFWAITSAVLVGVEPETKSIVYILDLEPMGAHG